MIRFLKLIILLAFILVGFLICQEYSFYDSILQKINSGKVFHFFDQNAFKSFRFFLACCLAILIISYFFVKKYELLLIINAKYINASFQNFKFRIKEKVALFINSNSKIYLLIISISTFCLIYFRVIELNRSLHHDEAKSIIKYISKSWYLVLTNYGVPNNHIFHNVLARISFQIFGDNVWAYRIPALLAGISLPLLLYILMYRWINASTSLIFYILVIFSSPLINYSVNARGYTLISMFFVVMILAIEYIKNSKMPFFGWVLLIFAGTFGLWTTTPMALYILIAYFWFLFNFKDRLFDWITIRIILSGIVILVLSLILYSPAILRCGIGSLISNEYLKSLDFSEFVLGLPKYFKSLFIFSMAGIPSYLKFTLLTLTILGLYSSLSLYRQLKYFSIIAILVFLAFISLKQFYPPERTVIPLIFLMYSLVALGIEFITKKIINLFNTKINYSKIVPVLSIFLIVGCSIHNFNTGTLREVDENQTSSNLPQLTKDLSKIIKKDDIIIVGSPIAAATIYYLKKENISQSQVFWIFDNKSLAFLNNRNRFYAITKADDNFLSLDGYFKRFNPDYMSILKPKKILEIGDLIIYQIND